MLEYLAHFNCPEFYLNYENDKDMAIKIDSFKKLWHNFKNINEESP